MSTPKTTRQWVVKDTKNGFDAASLNYRDLIIPKGQYPFPTATPVVPCSDGAGKVVAVGPKVSEFKEGDVVATLFNQKHQAGPVKPAGIASGLGGALDGALREYGVFPETGLVRAPSNTTANEASTLVCGTGGVSLAAIQFARAAGANVIATSSSEEKLEFLKKLGANHVINYKTDQNWGETAKKLTTGGLGVDHVIEVGGPGTMKQSMLAIKLEGTITVIGFLGGATAENTPSTLDALTHLCTVRGIIVGSRQQFEDMVRAIEASDIHPVVDKKVFPFEKAVDAYQYQWDQKHVGKVVIEVGT
ncbi:Zinc-type alcohol dehydrogenase-like protein [Cyphellophora attinorum]|uniref:Zinc-type alcohol dehydrogenase-like protein n=1 Tax=Cyphellophora attinorum TaxID=1664694 RepID=A0A0N1HN64_9EURO|nr:Zinc-type alcohol dehydrogenase-like protein [Phialophora attinorum]KPI38856.1 Zinc-type alcohol dehydrogenase-like protein [Phialophora attinorum]